MNDSMLKKQENALYRNDTCRHMFNYPGVYQLLVIGCISADGITLYSLIDLFLKQSQIMSVVITVAVAGVLNIAAVLLAACLHHEEFSQRVKKIYASLLISIFTLFFTAVFILRVASMEQMYGSNSNDLGIALQNDGGDLAAYSTEEEEFDPTVGQSVLAGILGLEPLGTSVLCFYIGYEQSPRRKRRHLIELQMIELEEAIAHDKVMIDELMVDLKFDLDTYDEEQLKNKIALTVQQGEIGKNDAVRKLTEHDGTPEGVSHLMEGEYLRQNKDAEEGTSASAGPAGEENFNKVKSIA